MRESCTYGSRRGTPSNGRSYRDIRQIEAPQGSVRSTPKPMIRRVNTSIITMTQWLRRSIDSQRNTIGPKQEPMVRPG